MDARLAPTCSLIRIRASASIQQAAQLMCDMSMGALGVDDTDHGFIGLITERDLLWAVAQGKDPSETTVEEIVNDFPIIVYGPIEADDAARKMTSGHVRHLIVREGDDLRIVSMRDLLTTGVGASGSQASDHTASTSELRRMFGASFVKR